MTGEKSPVSIHPIIKLRRLIETREFYDTNKLISVLVEIIHSRKRLKKRVQIDELIKLTKNIDIQIVTQLLEKEELSINDLVRDVPFPHQIYLRCEVLDHYNIIKFNYNTLTMIKGENFGEVDITELPVHADQIPLFPREKMVYMLVKKAEEYGGYRTVPDIATAAAMIGDPINPETARMSLAKLKHFGIIRKDDKKFGYPAYYTTIDLFIAEDYETLLYLCKKISEVTLCWRRKNDK